MKYQPLNDLIDPDVAPEDAVVPEPEQQDPNAPNDAYVIGERGNTVQAPDASRAKRDDAATGPRPWVKPLAILMAAVCIGLTAWNISRVLAGPPPPPRPSPFQVKQALYLGVMKIEAYRRVHGVTPGALEDAGLSSPPYSYRRLSPVQYAVTFDTTGSRLEYESVIPMEKYFGTPSQMLSMGGSR